MLKCVKAWAYVDYFPRRGHSDLKTFCYLAYAGHHVSLKIAMYLIGVDFPKQPFYFLFDFPLSVYTHGDYAGTKQHNSECAGGDYAVQVRIILWTQFVVEATARLVVRFVAIWPVDLSLNVYFVLLRTKLHQIKE